MIHRTSLLPTITATLLLTASACADDDSSASTSESSTSTGMAGDGTTSTTTAVDPTTSEGSTTAADSTTSAPATDDAPTSTGSSGSDDTEPTGGSSTGSAGLEIVGQWYEEFAPGQGIDHVIDEARWDQLSEFGDAVFHIDSYDNSARWVVAQADAANEFNPELWNRFDWTWDGSDLYYCTAAYDAVTAEDALDAPPTYPSDLDAGCGGFPWSLLMPAP